MSCGGAHDRVREPERVDAAREPGHLGTIVARFVAHDDGDGRPLDGRRGRERVREGARDAVLTADAVGAELAVRRRERPGEAHAARDAVELARDVPVVGEDQIGPDDARDVLLEAVLPRQLDDLLGLTAVELVGDVRRSRAARAAQVQRVERFDEGEEVVPEGLDRRRRLRREGERLRADAPGDGRVRVVREPEESRGQVFGDVPGSADRIELRGHAGTGHQPRRHHMSVASNLPRRTMSCAPAARPEDPAI